MAHEITDQQRQQLDELGFVKTATLFDEETLAPVRAAFQRGWDALIADHDSRGISMDGIVDARKRPFLGLVRHGEPDLADFCLHPALIEIARQLLGDDVDLTWDQAIIKPPRTGSASKFGWHQDMWYAENGPVIKEALDPDRARQNETAVTVWIAVTETTIANGTLRVLPGFHKKGLLQHEWSDETNDYKALYDTSSDTPVELEAGQAILMRRYTPHASGGNTTDRPRMAYQLGYGRTGILQPDAWNTTPVLRGGKLVAKTAENSQKP